MKTKLFLILLFISSYTFAQLPTDETKSYTFTNGSLVNIANPGNGDLVQTGSNSIILNDRNGSLQLNGDQFNGGNTSSNLRDFTISFWIKSPNNYFSGSKRILQIYDGSGSGFRIEREFPNRISWSGKASSYTGGTGGAVKSVGIFDNQWHHIVLRFTFNNYYYYKGDMFLDGVKNTTLSNHNMLGNGNFFSSGGFVIAPSGNKYEKGIDDIKVFQRSLSNGEILALYNICGNCTATYVNKNATGNNDGTSWTDAYTNLQTAIDNNNNSSLPIWVAQGVYKPSGANGRSNTFLINKVIKIYGGFDGTETLLSERDVNANPTILSGDINNDDNAVITNEVDASRQDNLYHIVTLKGDFAVGGLINGFTITGGNANGSLSNSCSTPQNQQYDDRSAAAIYANPDGGSHAVFMKFKNCILEKNTATIGAISSTFGPCGAQHTRSTLDFESCIMRDNYTKLYENMYFGGSQSYDNKRYGSIVNCLLHNNKTDGANRGSVLLLSSGGSQNYAACDVDVINSTFTNNISPNNYALKVSMTNQAGHIYNSIIYGNGSSIPIVFTGVAPTTSHNIIEGGQFSGTNQDPLFVNTSNNNYSLQVSSPAVDTGDNSLISAGTTLDLLGYARLYNTTVDMGCYEYDPNSTAGVSNHDTVLTFTVYPNPVKDVLNIKIDTNLSQVIIYNLQGQKVINSNTKQVNVSNLSKGIYLIKIEDENGNIATEKFIKE